MPATIFDKIVGLPSVAAVIIGGALLVDSAVLSWKYDNYVKETARTYPIIRSIDALDLGMEQMGLAKRALTHYLVSVKPMMYHNPSWSESAGRMEEARRLLNSAPTNRSTLLNLDDEVYKAEKELIQQKTGDEDTYLPYRGRISEVKDDMQQVRDQMREYVPHQLLEARDSFKNIVKGTQDAALYSAIGGFMGIIAYLATLGLISHSPRGYYPRRR